jgi:hypothetical protein
MVQMVKCKNCGAEFQARVQMSEQSFKTAMLESQTESCPQCKQESTFTKDDYYFR